MLNPNLIYRRNMIDQSLISTTTDNNLISHQPHPCVSASVATIKTDNSIKTNNKKRNECILPSIVPKQQHQQPIESSLFQLNSSLLNHLFLTPASSGSTSIPTTSHQALPPSSSSSLSLSNSIFNSFALAANAQNPSMQFHTNQNNPFLHSYPQQHQHQPTSSQLPHFNNIFAINAIAAHYNTALSQSQLITVKNDQLVCIQPIQKSIILYSITNGRYVQPELLPLIFNNNSLTNNFNLQKILLKIFPVSKEE